MKKHFIIPMALSAMAIAPIVAITNIETKNEVEVQQETQTEFNLDFQDISNNFENALTAAKKHYEPWIKDGLDNGIAKLEAEIAPKINYEPGSDEAKRIEDIEKTITIFNSIKGIGWKFIDPLIEGMLETIQIEEITIVIPDLTKLDLSDAKYSSSPEETNDTEYEVGLKLDVELLNLLENNKPLNPDREVGVYLNHSDKTGFTFGKESQSILKEKGQALGGEWVYDFSSIGKFLRAEHKFDGMDYIEVGEELATYFSVASLFLVEVEISGVNFSEIGEILDGIPEGDFDFETIRKIIGDITAEINKEPMPYSLGLKEGIENKVTVYGQRHGSTPTKTSTNNVNNEDYKIAEQTFTTESYNPTSLSGGAIAGIVIGSLAGVALIGGSTFWFFKKEI